MTATIDHLLELGLNQLEAEVYALLLTHEPLTGYRIGQVLGKPTANVYKALEALSKKGAVLMEEGESRLCRAVPADEFVRQYERALLAKTQRAARALAELKPAPEDERIYQMASAAQIVERCRSMLARCQKIAVLDAFPLPLQALAADVEAAAARGATVFVQAYAPVVLPGVNVACPVQSADVLQFWASQQLNLVVDGAEVVLALLDAEMTGVHQAVWSRSLYLASMLHAGLMREHTVHRLMAVRHDADACTRMLEILEHQQFFFNSDVPGQRALLARFTTR